jgi:hypothetical protein
MSGVKGRSGKVTTPEQREARRQAAIAGGNAALAAAAERRTPVPPPTSSIDHPAGLLAAFPELASYPFPICEPLGLKDALECVGKSYKAKESEVELEMAKDKRDIARGKLLTREAHRQAVAAIVESIVSSLDSLPGVAAELVPPEQQPIARHKMQMAIAKLRAEIAEKIKG